MPKDKFKRERASRDYQAHKFSYLNYQVRKTAKYPDNEVKEEPRSHLLMLIDYKKSGLTVTAAADLIMEYVRKKKMDVSHWEECKI